VTAQEHPMKAIVHSRYGPPDVLELNDIDQPVIGDDAVLVPGARRCRRER
jgi:NADPH:quinone reductase-like Zn-dependent oxidoreductase